MIYFAHTTCIAGPSVLALSPPTLVLLRCHFFQGRSVSVGVSVKKSVVGLGFGVYMRAPSATVRFPRRYSLAL